MMVVPIQQQIGDTACGVHSIAAAYNVALGKDLHLVTYDEDQMRIHLEQCFENEQLTPFPPAHIKQVCKCSLKALVYTNVLYVGFLKATTLT